MGAESVLTIVVVFCLWQGLALAQVGSCVSDGYCVGQDDGRQADCADCKSYFLCENGALVIGKACPSILFFNGDTRKCDLEENAFCATTSGQSVTSPTSVTSETSQTSESYNCIGGCYGLLSGSFASCDSCDSYFDCPGGQLIQCPAGELFDADTRSCRPELEAVCLTTSATSQTSATSVTSGSSPSSKTSVSSETSQSSASSATSGTSVNSQSPTSSPLSQVSDTSQTSFITSESVFCLAGSCGTQPDGYYADCSDCQSYFECADGRTNRITCSQTLRFNPLTMRCDFEANVLCSTTSATSGSSPSSVTSLSSESSRSSRSSASSPSSRTSLSSESSEAIFCITDCAGIPDGIFPNCNDCQSSITCSSGAISRAFTCEGYLVINPLTLNCDFPANVVCATTTTSATSNTSMTSDQSAQSALSRQSETSEPVFCITNCVGIPDGRYPSCTNCTSYFDCASETGLEQECPTGLFFNPDGFCTFESNAWDCATTSAQSVTSGSSPSSPSSQSSAQSDISQQSVTSQMSETSRSSMSSNSSPSSLSSESSATSQYSPTSEPPFCVTSCDGIPSGFWADCNDCSTYFVCGDVNRQYDCSPLLFNPLTERCALAADVTCATTSASSASSDSSPSSRSSQTSPISNSSQASVTSGSSPSSGTSPSSITSQSSEQSETSAFSLTSGTSTKPFCLTGCIGVDGVFADCNNCRAYFICTGQSETNVTCDAPLWFNSDTEQCSFTQMCQTTSASSQSSATSPISESSPSSLTSQTSMTSDQSETSQTSGSSASSQSSDSSPSSLTSRSSQTSAFSVTSQKIDCVGSCDGVPSGLYADCSICDGYWDCATTFSNRTCETGLIWEADNMRCGVRTNLCFTTSATSATSVTSPTSVTSVTSPTSATSGTSPTSVTSVTSMSSEEGSGDVMGD